MTVLRNNRSWVVIRFVSTESNVLDIAIDFMDEYSDVFDELAKMADVPRSLVKNSLLRMR